MADIEKLVGDESRLEFGQKVNEIIDTAVSKTGDTITGTLNVKELNVTGHTGLSYLEFTNPTTGNGGYIDFHFEGSTSDYTSRIIEDASGRITLVATNGFAFPICTTKATATSSASSSKVAVVIQNYRSGSTWYRVWSDGWIEQGGYSTSAISNSTNTVSLTFAKKFTATPFVVTQKGNLSATSWDAIGTSGWYNVQELVINVTTSGFKTAFFTKTGYNGCVWYACGY